jgi:DNA replication licensing factor MCM4
MDPNHIERLITLRGIVIRCSDVVPEMKEASFTCTNCGQEERVLLDKGRINEPGKCKNCKEANRFKIVHNNCMFSDK